MNKPLFEYGVSTLQFESHPDFPIDEPIESVQLSEDTNAGGFRVQELGDDNIALFKIHFSEMDISDRAALKIWLEEVVKYKVNPFYYTNPYGERRLVKAWMEGFDFPINNTNTASGDIILRGVSE